MAKSTTLKAHVRRPITHESFTLWYRRPGTGWRAWKSGKQAQELAEYAESYLAQYPAFVCWWAVTRDTTVTKREIVKVKHG